MPTHPIDFQLIATSCLDQSQGLLSEWFPAGKIIGREFKVGSINGEAGTSLSINILTGKWSDFADPTMKGGDLISLYAALNRLSQAEAAKQLQTRLNLNGFYAMPDKPVKLAEDWTPIAVIQPPPLIHHHEYGEPLYSWPYYLGDGSLIGHICRWDTPKGKQILPLSWCRHADGREGWRWKSFTKPRPLYGLMQLTARPDAPVIIVEGEKAADAAARLLPDYVAITWPGGSKAVSHADWSPLAGRSCVIWPDADAPGISAANDVVNCISKIVGQTKIITPPSGVVAGYDLADAELDGWDTERVMALINVKPVVVSDSDSAPFLFLGYDSGAYYYLPKKSKQITRFSASEHSKANLIQLAPAQWWEQEYPDRDGCNWFAAANALINKSFEVGIFSDENIRGRGCWLDNGRIVYHAGDRLIVDGIESGVAEIKSKYVYQQARRIKIDQCAPASNTEAQQFLKLCRQLSWKNDLYGTLLAGWCVIAPICGTLRWRSHIWLNGPSGSGKTWTLENIIRPVMGSMALNVQGATTEPGIRQSLKADALPVIFDEAESEDQRGRQRIQQIIELARQASSEGEAQLIKGSSGGEANIFSVRSCFAFSSIGSAAIMRADTSRITHIELWKNPDMQRGTVGFDSLIDLWKVTTSNPDYCARLRSRGLHRAAIIADNAITFSRIAAEKLGDSRSGDQMGTLLAGAYSLANDAKLDEDVARRWVDKQDWSLFKPDIIDSDECQALVPLLSYHIRLDGDGGTQSIGELIQASFNLTNPNLNRDRKVLLRHGIKILPNTDYVTISNSHTALFRIFKDTQWCRKWAAQFSRIKDAQSLASARFGAFVTRAVKIPACVMIEEDVA